MEPIDRKQFLARSLQAAAGVFIAVPAFARLGGAFEERPGPFAFTQVPLPYGYEALEPAIDKRTMEIHYTKHHAAYVKNVAATFAEENIAPASAEEFFANVSKYSAKARNNGGGAWNHNLYWQVMRPMAGGTPSGTVGDAITAAFGSFEAFKQKFTEAGMKRFGSGWAWLVAREGKLEVGSTPDQDNPLMDVSDFRGTPLLGMDVWEHAYYLKYQNKRDEYISNWWSLVNWDEVARRMV